MASIISFKNISKEKIITKVLLDKHEVLSLKNAINNVFIFSENLFLHNAKIIQRGRKHGTKYFTIPFELRFRKKKHHQKICYQKHETSSKMFYIYTISKKQNF